MKALRHTFEKVGMKSLRSYINSGNVIFEYSDVEMDEMMNRLEVAIHTDFNVSIKVLIRSFDQF